MSPKGILRRPGKNDTLAKKQIKRLHRLRSLQDRFSGSNQGWVTLAEKLVVALLFLVNFALLYPFFGQEDRANVFSAPIIPLLADLTEPFIPFTYGIRLWLLVFMAFLPLSYYWLVKEISGRRLSATIATVMIILPVGIFLPARISHGLLVDDGAHMASLTIVPLVCMLALKFLRRGDFWKGVLAAFGTALVALTSPVGFMVLTTFMVVLTFSEILLGEGRLKGLRFVIMIVLAAGFASFWYNPNFALMTLVSSQGAVIIKTLTNLIPISFFLFPVAGVIGFLLFENRPQLQPLFIALFLTMVFTLFSLGAGVAHSAPSRFLPPLGLSLALLLGISFAWLFDYLRSAKGWKRLAVILPYRRWLAYGLMGMVFAVLTGLFVLAGPGLHQVSQAQVLGLTTEQKVGIWELRESVTFAENLIGYLISGLTALSVLILKVKIL